MDFRRTFERNVDGNICVLDILDVSTRSVLLKAGAQGLLTPAQADVLSVAHTLYGAVTQMVRLSIEGPFKPADVGAGVLRRRTCIYVMNTQWTIIYAAVSTRSKL